MTRTFYCCGVDWQLELGEASDLEGRMPLYSTVEGLKAANRCWEACGIVEVKLELVKWIEPQNFGRAKRK